MRKRMRFVHSATPIVLAFGMVTVFFPVAVTAQTTFYVDADQCPGPGTGTEVDPFCEIQDAIAVSVYGDEIIVAPGTYNELIDFLGKGVTLRSSGGRDVTIIDAGPVPDPGTGKPVVRCDSGEGPDTVLDGFTVTGGTGDVGGFGGGMFIDSSSPTVTNSRFAANIASGGGGMSISSGSPTVTSCIFDANIGTNGGGWFSDLGNSTLTNCVFTGNNATEGGGMFINRGGTTVTNCLFAGNSALGDGGLTGNGGGIRNSASNPTITSCTFSGNTAREGGGLRNDTSSHPLINNCIFWDNIAGETGNEIANAPGSTTTIGYRDIQGSLAGGSWDSSLGIDDGGNIDADPLFVDADGGDDTPGTDDDNLRLSAGSPAIDAGRSFGTQLDLDGNLRIIDDPATADTGLGFPAVIDMGAYEFGSPALCGKPGDLDGDGDVDIFDYALLQLVFTGPMAP